MSSRSGDRKSAMRFPWLVLMNLLPRTWREGGREGMIEHRPVLTLFSHLILLMGIAVVALPVYITFVVSTLAPEEVLQSPMPLVPGTHLIDNYRKALSEGASGNVTSAPVGRMMVNSLVTALVIAFTVTAVLIAISS